MKKNSGIEAKIEAFRAAAQAACDRADNEVGRSPFGHYFMWAYVRVGKKVYKVCAGSGCSCDPGHAVVAVKKLPDVVDAWYNLD